MNSLIQCKPTILPLLIAGVLTCFAPSPGARAVFPPPDGGYPGGNTAEGQNALLSRTTGGYNAAIGWLSLRGLTSGSFNTGVGAGTLALNNADQNTAIGTGALLFNNSGGFNTATGAFALFKNVGGVSNSAFGQGVLKENVSGNDNTAVGANALLLNTTGGSNTAIGSFALLSSTGVGNTAIGRGAGSNVSTANGVICIGHSGQNVTATTWIENVYGYTTQSGTTAPVIVSEDGQLGTIASSERFKKDISAMGKASETILSLRPVTFHYKTDINDLPQFGLIAEEVAKVNPVLVLLDKEGKPYTVRYDQVNAMLLNEFLKDHHKVEKLEAALDAVNKRLEEQEAKIRKVSDQAEPSKPAPQVVSSNR
jgi:hypothetical protein